MRTSDQSALHDTGRVTITSYGARWNDPPRRDGIALVLDVSRRLWNPPDDPTVAERLTGMTGLDDEVSSYVLAAPDADRIITDTGRRILALLHHHDQAGLDEPVYLDVHCWYGRHRAPATAEAIASWLRHHGVDDVDVHHRDLHRPLIRHGHHASTSCVFCRIVDGTEPARIIRRWTGWRDVLAFVPLNPVTPGHLLVVPARHVTDVGTDPVTSATTMAAAAELADELPAANVITSRGAAATQTVGHLHYHVIPRTDGDGLPLPWTRSDGPMARSSRGPEPGPSGSNGS